MRPFSKWCLNHNVSTLLSNKTSRGKKVHPMKQTVRLVDSRIHLVRQPVATLGENYDSVLHVYINQITLAVQGHRRREGITIYGHCYVVESTNEHDYTKTAAKETWFSSSCELLERGGRAISMSAGPGGIPAFFRFPRGKRSEK